MCSSCYTVTATCTWFCSDTVELNHPKCEPKWGSFEALPLPLLKLLQIYVCLHHHSFVKCVFLPRNNSTSCSVHSYLHCAGSFMHLINFLHHNGHLHRETLWSPHAHCPWYRKRDLCCGFWTSLLQWGWILQQTDQSHLFCDLLSGNYLGQGEHSALSTLAVLPGNTR